MDVSNVSANVSGIAADIDEHRHRRNIKRKNQKVIECLDKSSTHLDVIENRTVKNSQQIINIKSTLQKLNRKLPKRQPDKNDDYLQNHTSLEKGNITDNGNMQNVSTFPSILTRKVTQEKNVEYSTFSDDSSSNSPPLLSDQADNIGVQNIENNVYRINNNSHNTENSKGPQFKRKITKVSNDNRITHNSMKHNPPDQNNVAFGTFSTSSYISHPSPTASRSYNSQSTVSYSKGQNLEDKPKQTASKSINSSVNHDKVHQSRPNKEFHSEFCMNEITVHPKSNFSFGTGKVSIYGGVIPVTLNNVNSSSETWNVLSIRDRSESLFSDENSLTYEKQIATQCPETKDEENHCDKTSGKSQEHIDIRRTAADLDTKQENAERRIQAETSSSGYCTISRQLEVSTCDQETRNENNSSTKISHTVVATVTGEEKLPPNASYVEKQCDKVEPKSIPDDTTKDEEIELLEKTVVELTKEIEEIQRDKRKKELIKTIAELRNVIKKEKENIQSPRGETRTVHERVDDDTVKKETVNQYFHLIPPDDRIEFHDVLILYNSDNDLEEAERFKLHLQYDFKLGNGRKIKVALCDGAEMNTGTNLKFEHLEKSFERCTLKFIFLTESFVTNDWDKVCNESFIHAALYNKEYHWSIIPIHVHQNIKTPFGLNSLNGFKYYKRNDDYAKCMLKLLEENVCKREEKERDLIESQYDMLLQLYGNKIRQKEMPRRNVQN